MSLVQTLASYSKISTQLDVSSTSTSSAKPFND